MIDPVIININVEITGIRLDKYLAGRYPDYSRTFIQKLIAEGMIKVNGVPVKPGIKLSENDVLTLFIPPEQPSTLNPETFPLKVVYEDDEILVIDKPAGITTHASPGQTEHTLVNALLSICTDLYNFGDTLRPGIVHRLDKDTSGLIIVTKNTAAQKYLIEQFKTHSIEKTYITLVKGRLVPEKGIIEAPIGRSLIDRKRMTITNSGKAAKSIYKVLKHFKDYSLLEVTLETGRTHQIRVHFAAIGFPIIGDKIYGVDTHLLRRQFLHASRLRFKLPASGKEMELKSELPVDLQKLLDVIG